MDIQTYSKKVADAIYASCDKKRKYKDIVKNVETAVDNENLSPVPYYYLNVLNVVTDMGLDEYYDDALDEKLKKYSRELTLFRLHHIVTDMFQRHFDDEDDVVEDFATAFEDEFKNNFKYMDLLTQFTPTIVTNIRQFTGEFVQNIEDFDFRSFDKELTENMYDCIDCEDEFEEIDEDELETDEEDEDSAYEPDSGDETDDMSESESEEEDEEIHALLDAKIEEIRTLKERVSQLESELEVSRGINEKCCRLLKINENRTQTAINMVRFGFIAGFVFMFAPFMTRKYKIVLDDNLIQ
jgi:hypothetical protein